jgi:hypothetical protein
MRHCERSSFDPTLFDNWAETGLFAEIQRRRIDTHHDRPAVLILDDCTAHESDWLLDEPVTHHVTLHVPPPHSSDQTQALDLGLFGITKQALTKVRLDSEKSA